MAAPKYPSTGRGTGTSAFSSRIRTGSPKSAVTERVAKPKKAAKPAPLPEFDLRASFDDTTRRYPETIARLAE